MQIVSKKHDKLVEYVLFDLSNKVDGIVLAQASKARFLDVIFEEERSVSILSSPRLALEKARQAADNQ
jgi:hypothetical protein